MRTLKRNRTAEVLDRAVARLQEQLQNGELKGSMADLVRLLQMREEIREVEEQPTTVRWVDEWSTPEDKK